MVAAGAVLLRFSRRSKAAQKSKLAVPIAACSLNIPVSFCTWFYSSEFHRISPELAGAGLEAGVANWLVGGTLAVGLITAVAYQFAPTNHSELLVSSNLSVEVDTHALHESGPIVFLIAIQAIYLLLTHIVSVADVGSSFGRQSVWFYISSFWDSSSLLVVAQAVAGLLLCWTRLRRRSHVVPRVLTGLSRHDFGHSWQMLAFLLVIAVPTLNAFGFIAWLGPFNLRWLFGF
jgi:hypothetical protein